MSFAPAFVLIAASAACGSSDADCELDPCACQNPPSCRDGGWFGPDAEPPPACLPTDDGSGCGECAVAVRRDPSMSICIDAVCDVDPSCCFDVWDERCVSRADDACPEARCVNAISFGGEAAVSYAIWEEPLVPRMVPGSYTGASAIAWSDRLAFSTTGTASVIAAPSGWGAPGSLVADPTLMAACDGATRVRWGDLDDGPDRLDLVTAGACGLTAVFGNEAGFAPAVTILAEPVDDVELLSVNDGSTVAVVSNAALAATYVYALRQTGAEPISPALPAASRIESCDVVSTSRRDIVLITAAGLEVYDWGPGGDVISPSLVVDGALRDVTCGDVLARGDDELIVSSVDGPVLIVDLQGEVVWSSATDLSPPLAFAGQGIDAGDLDGDGDVDVLIAQDGADAPAHVLLNNGTVPLSFEHVVVPDLAPGDPMRAAEMTYLRE